MTAPPEAANIERALEIGELAARAREPAAVGNVRFGTAGWTDPSLVKSRLFYPRGASDPKARLLHYAHHFDLVEVDATYYTLMPPGVAARWVSWVPDTFRFNVKAHPILTGHPIDVARLPKDLKDALAVSESGAQRVYPDKLPEEVAAEIEQRFRAFVDVLAEAGRLGAVLLQFPPWFQAVRKNARTVEAVAQRWADVPIAVEFRHRSWLESDRRDRVFGMLERARASYVVVDEPDVASGGVPPVVRVTNPELAVVRFHGQNKSGWQSGSSVAERFDYVYTEAELAAWVEPVVELSRQAREVHAIFNNCVRNYAILDAKSLSVLLERREKPPLGG